MTESIQHLLLFSDTAEGPSVNSRWGLFLTEQPCGKNAGRFHRLRPHTVRESGVLGPGPGTFLSFPSGQNDSNQQIPSPSGDMKERSLLFGFFWVDSFRVNDDFTGQKISQSQNTLHSNRMFSFSKAPHLPSNLILLSVLGEQLGIPVSPDRKLRHRLVRCHTGSVMTSEGHRHCQPPSPTSHSQIWWTSSRRNKEKGSLNSVNRDQDPTCKVLVPLPPLSGTSKRDANFYQPCKSQMTQHRGFARKLRPCL